MQSVLHAQKGRDVDTHSEVLLFHFTNDQISKWLGTLEKLHFHVGSVFPFLSIEIEDKKEHNRCNPILWVR